MAAYSVRRSMSRFLLKELTTGEKQQQQTRGFSSRAFQARNNVEAGFITKPVSADPILSRMYSVEASEQMNLIRRLRERTSAPIKDVKSSLVSCNWDIEEAQKDLRKRGVILASKKSARTATEGLLAVAQNDKKAVVIELNCETDFVARNDVFQHLASSLARKALLMDIDQTAFSFGSEYLESMKINLDHPKLSGETSVREAVTEVAAMVGENVKLRRGFSLSSSNNGVIGTYLHTCPHPGLGRIVGLVSLEAENNNASFDALKSTGASIAMHIVASKPLYLSKDLVPQEAVQSEREILKTQAESSGKHPNAIEKMVEGRLRKYFEDVVLLEQKFVINDSKSIKAVLSDLSKEAGCQVNVGNFLRMEIGEGIARSEAN